MYIYMNLRLKVPKPIFTTFELKFKTKLGLQYNETETLKITKK